MKKRFLGVIAAALLFVTLWPAPARADDNNNITLSPTFKQTEARGMLDMINAFRTGDEAFYWNESNTATVTSRGNPLAYSYTLEEIAMQRAAEIALSFSHTRPDGTRCFTALASDGTRSWGENIAAGTTTASAAFTLWREDDKNYAGQGHRRNMLSTRFQAVGIGHAVADGVHFWVQEFSYYTDSMTQTEPLDAERAVTISVAPGQIQTLGDLSATPERIELAAGGRAALPTVSVSLKLSDAWPNRETVVGVEPAWTSGDSGVCTVAGQEVSGAAAGSTTLTGTALGRTVSVAVNVSGTGGGGGQPAPVHSVYAILYTDGTLVFQNDSTPKPGRMVISTYIVDLTTGYAMFSYAPWYSERESIRVVDFSTTVSSTSTAYWFYGCTNLERVDNIQNLNTANVTDMQSMFSFCSKLTTLNTSHFDTANVVDMKHLFSDCRGLIELDLSCFDTTHVTDMRGMFELCYNLRTIHASDRFTTASVTDSNNMFQGCTSLVGGNRTAFDSAHTDKTYARIDTPYTPGYFTAKNAPAQPDTYTVSGAPSGNEYRVKLTNPAPVTVAVMYFDAGGKFLSAATRAVEANAGSVSFPLTAATTTRVALLDAACAPLCVYG